MKTTPAPEEVEDRLLRTFAMRAEDMAPGDGGTWDPTARFEPIPRLEESAAQASGRRNEGRRFIWAAAALIVGLGTAGLVVHLQDDHHPVISEGPSTADDAGAPGNPTADAQSRDYAIGAFEGEGYRIEAIFHSGATAEFLPPTRTWEPVGVGSANGYYTSMPGGSLSRLLVVVDGGIVQLYGGSFPRERLIAAGATIVLDPATGRYTVPAPAGWTAVEFELPFDPDDVDPYDPDEVDPAVPPPAPPRGLGFFVSSADDTRSYGVIWYPGWNEDNVPAGSEQVQVGDHEAYVGTIAPGSEAAGLLQLWIMYEDGVVEFQAAGLSTDELVVAGTGVRRLDDSSFDITPAPGFEVR